MIHNAFCHCVTFKTTTRHRNCEIARYRPREERSLNNEPPPNVDLALLTSGCAIMSCESPGPGGKVVDRTRSPSLPSRCTTVWSEISRTGEMGYNLGHASIRGGGSTNSQKVNTLFGGRGRSKYVFFGFTSTGTSSKTCISRFISAGTSVLVCRPLGRLCFLSVSISR